MFYLDLDLLFLIEFSVQPAQTGGSVPPGDSPFPCLLQRPDCAESTSFPKHIFSHKEDLPLPYGTLFSSTTTLNGTGWRDMWGKEGGEAEGK